MDQPGQAEDQPRLSPAPAEAARRPGSPPALPAAAASARRAVEGTWRIDAARIIATVTRYVGDFALAEDFAQEAFADALTSWPESGAPRNPAAWLTTAAKRKAIDHWRRRERLDDRIADLGQSLLASAGNTGTATAGTDLPWDPDTIDDDVLRLLFISAHPVLGRAALLPLTLRVVGGLTTEQVARALLLSVPTVQQRIVRAKRVLAAAEIPFELPSASEWSERLGGVLGSLYLMFSEGHVATSGSDWMRPELAFDALRLTRITAGLLPREPETHGLVALMAFTASRFPARLDPTGAPILLADQDRSRWDRSLIRLGGAALKRSLDLREARGTYAIQAQIAEVHASARTIDDTDWERTVTLYGDLSRIKPSAITDLNKAIAIAEARGPAAGLERVDALAEAGALSRFHLIPSVRGELLARLGEIREARAEFHRAAKLATNDREREVLEDKARRLS
ncbi:RNA polymerase sigma factor [Brevibacterium renqingii]|uniref:RNA polymerase sigma factor n=1 Tax=Brevibacterium renqingii TaxID=2776916 RepID=UPI001AE0E32E|nr:DUF6596 domain-containing protein [Brevibacterium renqingii]